MADSAATLRRHNSVSTLVMVPTKLSLPHRTTSLDLELVSLKSPTASYTSLRDMLPSTTTAVNSPTASSAAIISSGQEISIRNRLVKQAAWAYLQPMSASPTTCAAPPLLRRIWHRFTAFLSFINHHLLGCARIFYRILHALRSQASS